MFFTSGGSESTDSALRLARAYQVAKGRPDRWKIIGRHPSYHGMTLGTMAAASHLGRQKGYEPMLLPFPKVPWDDAEQVAKVFEQEDPATIAGFIAEPLTVAAGACLTASDEYCRARGSCTSPSTPSQCRSTAGGRGRRSSQCERPRSLRRASRPRRARWPCSPSAPMTSPTIATAQRSTACSTLFRHCHAAGAVLSNSVPTGLPRRCHGRRMVHRT